MIEIKKKRCACCDRPIIYGDDWVEDGGNVYHIECFDDYVLYVDTVTAED